MNEPHLILGIGELLWDVLPDRTRLGGAPANFSVMAGRLGDHAAILSRIGRDDSGREAVAQREAFPVDTSFLQVDARHETGRVTVRFEAGHPAYTIHQPSAWDFLELTDEWVQLAERADALCFGSPAQRSPQARRTIQELVAQTQERCARVFDVNLRPPYYASEIIQDSIELATVLRTNDVELPQVLALLNLPSAPEDAPNPLHADAMRLLHEFPALKLIAVIRGAHGSLLVTREDWHEHPGVPSRVADTVGAGDAFTAAIVHYLPGGADLCTLNEAGNRWGAWIACQVGAMPLLPDDVCNEITVAVEG